MDAEKLWERVKEVVSQMDTGEDKAYSFKDVVAVSCSESTRLLTLQAKNFLQANYLRSQYGDPLVTALESIIGQPAYVECTYTPTVRKTNPRFTVHRISDSCISDEVDQGIQKSAFQLVLEDISDLKRRVAELEKLSK